MSTILTINPSKVYKYSIQTILNIFCKYFSWQHSETIAATPILQLVSSSPPVDWGVPIIKLFGYFLLLFSS